MISPTDKMTFVQTLSRQARLTATHLKDDRGAAGLVIAMIIMIVSFSALSVFLSKHSGPASELSRLQSVGRKETILKANLLVHFNQFGEMPCPDNDRDGDEDACTGGATSSGTLPWKTLGISRDDAIDAYGTYYTYVVADAAKEFCASVPNDYDGAADPEFTGDMVPFDDLETVATTAGATGTNVPFAVISHGKNRLGGISSNNTALAAPPAGSDELINATANPTTIYTGPFDADTDTYFDDTVWAPVTSDLAKSCEQKTEGGALNADLTEDFAGADGDVDQTKFETVNAGTEVQQEAGQAVFSDETAYMTTAASNVLNSTERPLYISAEWTPASASSNGGFSIVTRAEATPTAGVFDPGIAFRFFDGTGATGDNTISIMDNGAQVAGFTSGDNTFTMTFGETYLLEVFDNGDEVWMQISQKNLQSNRAYAYAAGVTGDTDGTRIAFVNGTTSESRLDNIVVGRPMLAMDTLGTGHAQASGNGENDSTTGTVTLEGWFKPRSLPTGGNTATLISQWDSNQPNRSSHRLFMSSGGALSLSLGDGSATTDTEELGVSLTAGKWTHLAVMYDDEATYGEITVYVDGSHAKTITGTVDNQILSGNPVRTAQEQFMVGADHAGVNAFDPTGAFSQNIFDGQVSDVRVWDDVRTAAEISQWYDRRLPIVDADPALDNLIVNWRFDRESGGFAAVQVEDSPASIGADGDILNGATWVGALLNTHRTTSTDVCDGFRVGAFRCDYRDPVANLIISGSDLGGIATVYLKVWGGGGGARVNSGVLVHTGGGGGYAAGLLLNTGQDLRINVGAGGAGGVNANGTVGTDSLVEQNTTSDRARGNGGGRGTNGADGAGGTGVANAALLTSVVATGVGVAPGCNPTSDPCSDSHYTTTGAPTDEVGRGGDDESTPDGRDGAVVLLW